MTTPKAQFYRTQYLPVAGSQSPKPRQSLNRNVRGQNGYYYAYKILMDESRIVGGFSYFETGFQGSPKVFYRAREAQYNRENEQWQLLDVTIFKFLEDFRLASIEKVTDLQVSLPEDIDYFLEPGFPTALSMSNLTQVLEDFQNRGLVLGPYFTEFYFRFSRPLICIILALFGILVGMRGGPRGGSALLSGLLFASAAILIYYWGISVGLNLGNAGIITPWLAAFSPNLGFLLLCVVYYFVFLKWKAD